MAKFMELSAPSVGTIVQVPVHRDAPGVDKYLSFRWAALHRAGITGVAISSTDCIRLRGNLPRYYPQTDIFEEMQDIYDAAHAGDDE